MSGSFGRCPHALLEPEVGQDCHLKTVPVCCSMFVVNLHRPWSLLCRAASVSPSCLFHTHSALLNSNRTSVVRCGRQVYERSFPTLLLRPDGSTVHIRYKEPRRLLVLPVDVSTLSEEERRARQKKREVRKVTQTTAAEEYHEDFRSDQYSHFWKKK